jgi:hypothetical protein
MSKRCLLVALVAALVTPVFAQEKLDLEMLTRIRQEGFRHSQVMQTASELDDRIGPRLTASPNMARANEWTRDQLAQWGLANAHLESWGTYDRGWQQQAVSLRMLSPDITNFIAYPKPWTPSTEGVIHGKAIKVKIEKKEDLDQYKGKLAGMIVLLGDMREVKMREKAMAERYDEKTLAEEFEYKVPGEKPAFDKDAFKKRMEFTEALQKFFIDEKALAVIEPSRAGDGGTVFVQAARNAPWKSSQSLGVPTVVVAIENYGRIARLLDRKVDVDLELNVANKFSDNVTNNDTVAEIPGTDPKLKDEVVMLGAHLDSWAGGTGATDNGSGSAVVMEAIRILKALDLKPRRTIRVALWSGEEQGLLGSEGYVRNHFAGFRTPTDPEEAKLPHWLRNRELAVITKPEHAKLAAYFNDDNGSGAFRGIYTQENAAVRPIFESWIEPLKDLGVTTVSERNTGGTDHESFDDVGLPGFQFIQDELEYDSRTHHSNMDVYERLQRDDLMQGSVVMAWFVYNAAMRDQMLPRKPMPKPEPPKPEEKKLEEKKPAQPKGEVTQPH